MDHPPTSDAQNIQIPGEFSHGAKAINLTGEDARALADLALHRSDLRFALESLRAINHPGITEHIQESLWRSGIVHFFKCFQYSKARSSLKVEEVYGDAPPEAMMNYKHFRAIRDKTLVHDENAYRQVAVAAVINDGSRPSKVDGVRAIVAAFATLDQNQYTNFHILVMRATEWVERQFNALESRIQASLEAMPYEKLTSMPIPNVRVPLVEEVSMTRTRQP